MNLLKKFVSILFAVSLVLESKAQNEMPNNFAKALSQIKNRIDQTEFFYKSQTNGLHPILTSNIYYENFILKMLNEFVTPSIPNRNITQVCSQRIRQLYDGLMNYQIWALKVIDSYGKPTSGILEGSFYWLGEFGVCKNATNDDWQGKYCLVNRPDAILPIKLGICVPKECDGQDIASFINFVIELVPKDLMNILPFNFTSVDPNNVICDEPKELNSTAIIAIVIFSLIGAMVLIGTLYDLYKIVKIWYWTRTNKHDLSGIILKNIPHDQLSTVDNSEKMTKIENNKPSNLWILSFSLYTNTVKLFKITKGEDQLDCLHALRVLSIAWVILGHTYIYSFSSSDNPIIIYTWLKRFSFSVIMNAYLAVDSFFFFSGLLTSYLFLKETSKGKLSASLMVKYYLHRIWRITPTYGLVLLFSYAITPYLGTGPLYPSTGFEIPSCGEYWWTNLLYINNFGDYAIKSCLPVSWYLANDMQFHFIAPVFLVPLALNKRVIAWSVISFLMVTHLIVTATIISLNPGFELGMGLASSLEFFEQVYIKPWCRIGPFLVGLIIGYIIYMQKKNNYKISLTQNILGWILSISFLLFDLFIIYPNWSGNEFPVWFNIIYQTFSRTLWAICLAFIIYACSSSNGGVVNKILSLPIWTPLSRLSFSIFLIHTTVIFYYVWSLEHMIHLQDSTMIYIYVAHLVFATCAAYLVSMFWEVPIVGLEKFIFKNPKN